MFGPRLLISSTLSASDALLNTQSPRQQHHTEGCEQWPALARVRPPPHSDSDGDWSQGMAADCRGRGIRTEGKSAPSQSEWKQANSKGRLAGGVDWEQNHILAKGGERESIKWQCQNEACYMHPNRQIMSFCCCCTFPCTINQHGVGSYLQSIFNSGPDDAGVWHKWKQLVLLFSAVRWSHF